MKIEDIMKDLSKEPKTIKQFKKKGDKLYHPLGNNSDSIQRSKILEDRLLTLGHLWIYVLIENNGYGDFLKDIIKPELFMTVLIPVLPSAVLILNDQ